MTTAFPALFISLPEGIIDLGWGHPSPRLHPLALMQQAVQHACAQTQTVMLGPDIKAAALLPFAQRAGVGYRPGPAFSATGAFPQAMRLSFALYEVDALVQGAERLGQAIAAYRRSHGEHV